MQHRWLLSFDDIVPEQLSELSPKDRQAVFRSIAQLLRAENPASAQGVKKLVEKRFEGLWRQRQGDYRIFFRLTSGEITHQKFVYKGSLHLVAIRNRSDAY